MKSLLTVSRRRLAQLQAEATKEAYPAPEDVALVTGTAPLFDAAWYVTRYDLPVDIDAAHHYLAEGAGLGFDPGPGFSTIWYLKQNADVREAGLNPLLHYLRYGRDEARLVVPPPLDDATRLRSGGVFDVEWYLRQNPDVVAAGMDPVDHYLAVGAAMDRDPGPAFSTRSYLNKYPDVAVNRLNPLVHYLAYGQAEGRQADPSREIPINASMVAELRDSGLFDDIWYLNRYPEVRAAGRDAAIDYLALGARDGRDPCSGFSTGWYLHTNPDVSLGIDANPFIHYVRHGLAEGRQPRMTPPDFETALRPASAARIRRAARATLRGVTRLATSGALWPNVENGGKGISLLGTALGRTWPNDAAITHVLDGLMHLHGLSSASEAALPPSLSGLGIAIGDLWFVNDGLVRMRIEAGEDGVFGTSLRLRTFQIERDRLVDCGGAMIAGDGPRFLDITPPNPFLPLLFVTTDAVGMIHGSALLPFPSLCRGGAHQAEISGNNAIGSGLAAACRASDAILAGWRGNESALIAAIAIDGTDATGAERIFSWPVREWLATIAHIPVVWERPGPVCAELPRRSPGGGATRGSDAAARLVLPADSLPTIAALLSRRPARIPVEGIAGSFLVAEPIGGGPCFMVGWSTENGVGLPALQPVDAPLPFPCLFPAGGAVADVPEGLPAKWPLAIRFHQAGGDPNRLIYRRSVEMRGPLLRTTALAGATVTVIVPAISHDEAATVLIASLACQTMAAAIELVLVTSNHDRWDAVADRFFPGRHHILHRGDSDDSLSRAVALAKSSHLLFVHEATVLHDPRTVETLLAMATAPRVASAACLHIHEQGAKATIVPGSGGLFAAAAPVDGQVVLVDAPSFPALPRATYPNAGNGLSCTLIPAKLWRLLDTPSDESIEMRGWNYARTALSRGFRHLATSAVTVTAEAIVDAGMAGQADVDHSAMPVLREGMDQAVPLLCRIAV